VPRLWLWPDRYLFYGQYSTEYGQAMAGLFLAVIPIIIFYLILQRQFISGISTGAVK
jgi:raffinose/stachyose/melibiose transport system permease protein